MELVRMDNLGPAMGLGLDRREDKQGLLLLLLLLRPFHAGLAGEAARGSIRLRSVSLVAAKLWGPAGRMARTRFRKGVSAKRRLLRSRSSRERFGL